MSLNFIPIYTVKPEGHYNPHLLIQNLSCSIHHCTHTIERNRNNSPHILVVVVSTPSGLTSVLPLNVSWSPATCVCWLIFLIWTLRAPNLHSIRVIFRKLFFFFFFLQSTDSITLIYTKGSGVINWWRHVTNIDKQCRAHSLTAIHGEKWADERKKKNQK